MNSYSRLWFPIFAFLFFISNLPSAANSNNVESVQGISNNPIPQNAKPPIQPNSQGNSDSKPQDEVSYKTLYLIGLGIITLSAGLYSTYNALEIYKLKVVNDKEQAELFKRLMEMEIKIKLTESQLEIKQQSLEFLFKELELKKNLLEINLEQSIQGAEEKMSTKIKSFENESNVEISKATERFENFLLEITYVQKEFEIEVRGKVKDATSGHSILFDEISRLTYTSSISKTIGVELRELSEDKKLVESALKWFSQDGNKYDLEILMNYRKNIHGSDRDIIDLCDYAINEIKKRNGEDEV